LNTRGDGDDEEDEEEYDDNDDDDADGDDETLYCDQWNGDGPCEYSTTYSVHQQ